MNKPFPMTSAQRCERIISALAECRANVADCYDEPLYEIVERVEQTGSLGKADIGALYLWKRIPRGPSIRPMLETREVDVRAITAVAVEVARDLSLSVPEAAGGARRALSKLPGMTTGDALASALILAAAPNRMAVYDRRAHRGLKKLCLSLNNRPGRYRRYMELVEQCRAELAEQAAGPHTAREVDLALYWLGRPLPHPS